MSPPRIAGFALLLLAPLAAAHATAWSTQSAVSTRTEYNDNYRLSTLAHSPEWITSLYPTVTASRQSDRSAMSATLGMAANQYAGENANRSIEPRFTLSSSLRGERYRGGLDAQYLRDSTLANELTTTGVVLTRAERNSASVNPSLQFNISESTALDLGYGLTDVSYDSTAVSGLFNFQNKTMNGGLTYQYSEIGSANVALNYFRYATSHREMASEGYNARVGFTQGLSDRLRGSVSVGGYRTFTTVRQDVTYCPGQFIECYFGLLPFSRTTLEQKYAATGYTGGATLEGKLAAGTAILGKLDRSVNPSGAGSVVQTDSIAVSLSTQWRARLSLFADASAYRTRFSAGTQAGNNGRYYALAPGLRWDLDQEMTIEAGLRRTTFAYDSGVKANSNAAFIGLHYQRHADVVSR